MRFPRFFLAQKFFQFSPHVLFSHYWLEIDSFFSSSFLSYISHMLYTIYFYFILDYGYYMYIETSAPRRPNDTARMISPTIRGNGTVLTRCVQFYYHMYGSHVNSLSVRERINGLLKAPIWMRNGTQGPNWRFGEVQVKTGDSFQVSAPNSGLDHVLAALCIKTGCRGINTNVCGSGLLLYFPGVFFTEE